MPAPVEDSRGVVLVLDLVLLGVKSKVHVQLGLQGGRQLACKRTQADARDDRALVSRKVAGVEETIAVPGRDYWCHLVLPTGRKVEAENVNL